MALDTSKPVLQTVGIYDLIEKVAEGGMGSVYRAKHRDTGQIVAIKIMPIHDLPDGFTNRAGTPAPGLDSAASTPPTPAAPH